MDMHQVIDRLRRMRDDIFVQDDEGDDREALDFAISALLKQKAEVYYLKISHDADGQFHPELRYVHLSKDAGFVLHMIKPKRWLTAKQVLTNIRLYQKEHFDHGLNYLDQEKVFSALEELAEKKFACKACRDKMLAETGPNGRKAQT